MANIRTFQYRPRRVETGFAVDFECAGRTNQGVCWNMAETGMRAEFASAVHLGDFGQLALYHAGIVLQIDAEVTHVNGRQAGLSFRFQNDREREEAADLARVCKPLEPTQ
ncbi:MAG TPA: PilZ domain-containing protein [Terracidiphilus sp.]|nr:PilZ domain-containing protein [Terracidiphilus sp.]